MKQSSESCEQKNVCPICYSKITEQDKQIVCPDCMTRYHIECWNENKGCATYGCKSAGCLRPQPKRESPSDTPGAGDKAQDIDESMIRPVCKASQKRGETFCQSCDTELNEHSGQGTIYKFSGRYEPMNLTIGILLGVLTVLLMSFIYTYVVHYNPIAYASAIVTFLYGLSIGWISHSILKYTKTRNFAWGLVISIILSFLALYFTWAFSLGIYYEHASFVPSDICRGIENLIETNTFNIRHRRSKWTISGVFVGLIYLVEAGMIFLGGIICAYSLNSSIGFCEKCKTWTKSVFRSPALSPITDISLIENELKLGKIGTILELKKVGEHDSHTSLVIQSCDCSDMNLLTIYDVVVEKKGKKYEENKTALLSMIIISSEVSSAIQVASWGISRAEESDVQN